MKLTIALFLIVSILAFASPGGTQECAPINVTSLGLCTLIEMDCVVGNAVLPCSAIFCMFSNDKELFVFFQIQCREA